MHIPFVCMVEFKFPALLLLLLLLLSLLFTHLEFFTLELADVFSLEFQ